MLCVLISVPIDLQPALSLNPVSILPVSEVALTLLCLYKSLDTACPSCSQAISPLCPNTCLQPFNSSPINSIQFASNFIAPPPVFSLGRTLGTQQWRNARSRVLCMTESPKQSINSKSKKQIIDFHINPLQVFCFCISWKGSLCSTEHQAEHSQTLCAFRVASLLFLDDMIFFIFYFLVSQWPSASAGKEFSAEWQGWGVWIRTSKS